MIRELVGQTTWNTSPDTISDTLEQTSDQHAGKFRDLVWHIRTDNPELQKKLNRYFCTLIDVTDNTL